MMQLIKIYFVYVMVKYTLWSNLATEEKKKITGLIDHVIYLVKIVIKSFRPDGHLRMLMIYVSLATETIHIFMLTRVPTSYHLYNAFLIYTSCSC